MGSGDGSTGRPCVKCGSLPAFYIWVAYTDDLPLCADCGAALMKEKAPVTEATGAESVGEDSV